jgi:hypothetical protein
MSRTLTASILPFLPVRGVIQVENEDTNTPSGFLSRALNQFGEYGTTVALPTDPTALIVEIPGAIFASGGAFFNLPASVSVPCAHKSHWVYIYKRRNYLTFSSSCSLPFPLLLVLPHASPPDC